MSEVNTQRDETEQIFEEYYQALDKANSVKNDADLPQRVLQIEYMQLVESYEKLLKTAVRISRLGDKAQKKLMKYKDLMDTLRSIE